MNKFKVGSYYKFDYSFSARPQHKLILIFEVIEISDRIHYKVIKSNYEWDPVESVDKFHVNSPRYNDSVELKGKLWKYLI